MLQQHRGVRFDGLVLHRRPAERFNGVQIEAAGEDRETLEKRALAVAQESVAPFDRPLEALLPGGCGAATADQQAEHVVEAGSDVYRSKHRAARGGQLDRQRDAVQLTADVRDGRGVDGAQLEVAPRGTCSRHEQLAGLRGAHGPSVVGDWQREGRDRPGNFARDTQRFATGRQHAQTRRSVQQALGDRGAALDDVLAVVQHEQHPARADGFGDRELDWSPRLLGHPEKCRQRAVDHAGIHERRQLQQPYPVRHDASASNDAVVGHSQGETRLAGAANADQCHQRRRFQEAGNLCCSGASTHQRGQLSGQIVRDDRRLDHARQDSARAPAHEV